MGGEVMGDGSRVRARRFQDNFVCLDSLQAGKRVRQVEVHWRLTPYIQPFN